MSLIPGADMQTAKHRQAGFSLIEVLVAIIILLIGFMGIAALSLRANQVEFESYQRAQALVLLDDMSQKLRANQDAASCYYAYTAVGPSSGTSYLGTGSSVSGYSCVASGTVSVDAAAMATQDVQDWDAQLDGLAVQGGAGAMIGARGCIINDASGVLIQVAWQAKTVTAAPPAGLSCGQNLYGDEKNRRVMARWVKIVNLTPAY
ncbi:type IV pilus modification protein PilV [Vogesella sp. GCM10023246]|uniref:Type IV pilus modification protein PilV n=1 Tax=Vogesella oryzagri TaxID=3160864 RepID=A0ABV1M1B8_9NEIS